MASNSGWRITRAGSIFIIVVVALAALLFGGVYLAQQRGERVRRDEAAEIARQNLENESNKPVVIGEDQAVNGQVEEEAAASGGSVTATAAPEQLPQTGPETATMLALFMLSLAVASYMASRQAARQL